MLDKPKPGFFSLHDLPRRKSVDTIALSTGWPELDVIWRPYPGQFTAVTGLTGHGKSTFVMNVMCKMAQTHGTRWFNYVPENEGQLWFKLKRIWNGAPHFDDFAKNNCFIQSSWPEWYGHVFKNIEWVLDHAADAVDKQNVDIIFIDPWNEIERAKPKDMALTDYIGQCLVYVKQFARAKGVAVIMVGHPTKDVAKDNRKPTLYDMEGSAHWANKCDNGLVVYRKDENSPDCLVVSVKVRELGSGRRGEQLFSVDEETEVFRPVSGGYR